MSGNHIRLEFEEKVKKAISLLEKIKKDFLSNPPKSISKDGETLDSMIKEIEKISRDVETDNEHYTQSNKTRFKTIFAILNDNPLLSEYKFIKACREADRASRGREAGRAEISKKPSLQKAYDVSTKLSNQDLIQSFNTQFDAYTTTYLDAMATNLIPPHEQYYVIKLSLKAQELDGTPDDRIGAIGINVLKNLSARLLKKDPSQRLDNSVLPDGSELDDIGIQVLMANTVKMLLSGPALSTEQRENLELYKQKVLAFTSADQFEPRSKQLATLQQQIKQAPPSHSSTATSSTAPRTVQIGGKDPRKRPPAPGRTTPGPAPS